MNAEYDAIFESVEKVGIKVMGEKTSVYLKVTWKSDLRQICLICAGTYLGSNRNLVTCRVYTINCASTDLQDPTESIGRGVAAANLAKGSDPLLKIESNCVKKRGN
jgi:hypothetical protein